MASFSLVTSSNRSYTPEAWTPSWSISWVALSLAFRSSMSGLGLPQWEGRTGSGCEGAKSLKRRSQIIRYLFRYCRRSYY